MLVETCLLASGSLSQSSIENIGKLSWTAWRKRPSYRAVRQLSLRSWMDMLHRMANHDGAHETATSAHDPSASAAPGTAESAPPPGDVPGYRLQRRLGTGAYGEVWVAVDNNTGRRVAIKFFANRARLDPNLLSREIEKLVFLSADRYVVQLLEVGWGADPPYFIMEFVEYGSLEDRIRRLGKLPIHEAAELFRQIATGLAHAHGKGILHCDLKPANILLDQDLHPRLADFGQARLSHEQRPSLGTLFYMAPEQADLRAIPDARWDVYALGAIMYCMLVGSAPHMRDVVGSEFETARNLEERLQNYRHLLRNSPPPSEHRRVPGMDRALAEIVDRCLKRTPSERYSHVVHVLDDLAARDEQKIRRPLTILGLLLPLLLLVTMGFFAHRAYQRALAESRELTVKGALATNTFAARGQARLVAHELETRFQSVARLAESATMIRQLQGLTDDTSAMALLPLLADPRQDPDQTARARSRFASLSSRLELEAYLQRLLADPRQPPAASWFITDARGTMVAAAFRDAPPNSPIGDNFAYRSYFHGGAFDLPTNERPGVPLRQTSLSALFQSTATLTWKVAISTPIRSGRDTLGVLAMTVELGEIFRFPASENLCGVLVDGRTSEQRGTILAHPVFDAILTSGRTVPAHFAKYRFDLDAIQSQPLAMIRDPISADPEGAEYRGQWLVSPANVTLALTERSGEERTVDTGLMVLVQLRRLAANQPLDNLARRLFREGVWALFGFLAVTLVMWLFVVQLTRPRRLDGQGDSNGRFDRSPASVHTRETLEQA